MGKHTPGPWYAIDSWNEIYAPDDDIPPWHICRVSRAAGFQEDEDEQSKANAQLICAAPDLLEACQAARKLFDQGCVDRGYKDEHNWIDETLDKIDAAIAKATGEQTNG